MNVYQTAITFPVPEDRGALRAAKDLTEHRDPQVLRENRDPQVLLGNRDPKENMDPKVLVDLQMALLGHLDRLDPRVPQDQEVQLDLLVQMVQRALEGQLETQAPLALRVPLDPQDLPDKMVDKGKLVPRAPLGLLELTARRGP